MSWLSQLLGEDAQHHADTQLNQAQNAFNNATSYLGQAGSAYQNLGGQAAADQAAFLPTQSFVPQSSNVPTGPGYVSGSGGSYQTNAPNGTDVGGSGYGLIASNALNQYNTATAESPDVLNQYEAATGLSNNDTTQPYQLNPQQQAALNGQIDILSNAQTASQNQINAAYAARGLNDPSTTAAANALLNQNYAAAKSNQTAQYSNAAAATAATGAGNVLNYLGEQQGQGTGALENAVAGINNLSGESAAGEAGVGGQFGNLSNQQNAASNQSQGQANAAVGSILQLGGAALGGAFGVPSNPFASSGSSSSGGTNGLGGSAPITAPAGGYGPGYDTSGYPTNAFNGGSLPTQNIFGATG